MPRTFQGRLFEEGHIKRAPLVMGLTSGFLGGLAGTLVMDLVLMGAFSALGLSATTCFSIVGETIGRFLSLTGVDLEGSVKLGILTHYVVGPLIGTIFGIIVAQAEALRLSTLKKIILVAIVYVEILSQPMLAMTPILLKMTVPVTLEWYGGSFVMHLIVAAILGSVVGYALRQESDSQSTSSRFRHIARKGGFTHV